MDEGVAADITPDKIRDHVHCVLDAYVQKFGGGAESEAFRIFITSHRNQTGRNNLAGHITGSALVWHPASDSVLRVYHAKLNCWVFSAGGHIELGEFPWQASTRELHEETGIQAAPMFDPSLPVPLYVGVHPINASVKKAEAAHWHYDMVYLFKVVSRPTIVADPREVSEFRWVPIDDVTIENSPIDLRQQMIRYGV